MLCNKNFSETDKIRQGRSAPAPAYLKWIASKADDNKNQVNGFLYLPYGSLFFSVLANPRVFT